MKIRSILTIKYAGITATIFLVFMATIYCVNEHLRSDSFYRSLRSEAITKAHLFLNNQVDVKPCSRYISIIVSSLMRWK